VRIIYNNAGLVLDFIDGIAEVIVIENAKVMRDFICEIWRDYSGHDAAIMLIDEDKKLNMHKSAELIFNPFAIDVNSKKLKKLLYSEMKDISNMECQLEFYDLQSNLIEYINKVGSRLPYAISFDGIVDFVDILQLMNTRFEIEDIDLEHKLTEYVKLVGQLEGRKLFVFVNLKMYMEDSEIKELYKIAFYYGCSVMLIESAERRKFEEEHVTIIDKDQCIIEY